jgi:hypothetical protein
MLSQNPRSTKLLRYLVVSAGDNADHEATIASMEKVDALLRTEKAIIWVNHDTAQSETVPHAPIGFSEGGEKPQPAR